MGKTKYIYQQIRDYLLDLIALKHNVPDEKLPSENQLCAKFGVSRVTAKNAVSRLQKEGLVYRIQGKGTFTRGGLAAANPPIQKNGIICLLIPALSSPFLQEIIDGCSDFFQKTDEQLFVINTRFSRAMEIQAIDKVMKIGAKGFIVYMVNEEHYNKTIFKLALNNFPIILIDRIFTGFDISSVTTDHVDSAYGAVNYLGSKGKKHIGIILPNLNDTSSLADRIAGYEKALIMNGLPINMDERLFVDLRGPAKERIIGFLKANPQMDGLLSIGDDVGLDLYRAIRELGIPVPSRLSVIFFDNEYEKFKDMLPFTPTVIAQEAYTIGYEAARALTNMLDKPLMGITRKLIPSKLILGQSTEG
jgi:GntR family transcriptional regulator of arabinose operon